MKRRFAPHPLPLLLGLFGAQSASASHLAIAPVDDQTGAIGAATIVQTWDGPTGFSHIRAFTVGGASYVVALDQRTGALEIYDLDGGELGSLQSIYQLGRRFTSMEIASPGGVPHLVLHDLNDGTIRTYPLNAGSLGAGVTATDSSWKDKDVFETYRVGSNAYFFGYDRFTGNGRIHQSSGELVDSFSWTLGWSDGDYVTLANTYRALYKWADHPGNQGGWLKLDRIDAGGTIVSTPYNNSNFADGYTTVEFVRRRASL